MNLRKKLYFLFAFTLCAASGIFYFNQPVVPFEKPTLEWEESTIGNEENPQARRDYETNMLIDPATRQLPKDIRTKELRFSRRIKNREQYNAQRTTKENQVFNGTEWQADGPHNIGGRTRALAIDISNENRLLAGAASGGMWLSENGGASWQKTTDASQLHSVTSLAQDTRAGKTDTWYYGTGEMLGNSASGGGGAQLRGDGIFKSTDGGNSWTLLSSSSTNTPEKFDNQFTYVWNIATNPYNTLFDEVMVAAFGGILRSIDGGNNWQLVLGDSLKNESSTYTDITISSDGTWYATLSDEGLAGLQAPTHGIFQSTDGVNWQKIEMPQEITVPENYKRVLVKAAPSNPDILYFFYDAENPYFYRWDKQSNQWEDLSAFVPKKGGDTGDFDSQGSYNLLLEIHPENPDLVYLGGTNLYRSTNSFRDNNSSWIGGYNTNDSKNHYPGHHPDQHALVFYPSNPNKMLSGHDGGVSLSDDSNSSKVEWESLNNGYVTAQFYTIAIDPENTQGLVMGGMQDNGTFGSLSGSTQENWTELLGGDGAYCAIAPNSRFVYLSFQNSQIYRVRLNNSLEIEQFARVDPKGGGNKPGQKYLFINPFVLDPNNYNKMYLAGGDKIWINSNLTQIETYNQEPTATNWYPVSESKISPLSQSLAMSGYAHTISALAVSQTPANTLYYGTSLGELYRVKDATPGKCRVTNLTQNIRLASSCRVSEAGESCLKNAYISSIAVDPTDADKVLVAFSNYNIPSLFYSENGGQTFKEISANLEENPDGKGSGPSVRWVNIIPMKEGKNLYLAGTSTGLYSTQSLDEGQLYWAQEANEMIGNVVVPMVTYRPTDGKVMVATHGNGVYSKTFEQILPVKNTTAPSDELIVEAAFPNPFTSAFNGQTFINFHLPKSGMVTANILNTEGKRIKTILQSEMYAGENQIGWDGTNTAGKLVKSGMYIYQIEFEGIKRTGKVLFTK